MNLKILILPGDGIGLEVTRAATQVLNTVAKKFGHTLDRKSTRLNSSHT